LRKIDYTPGQYLTLEIDSEHGPLCRAYSISSTPGLDKSLSITVKRVSGGTASQQLVQHLNAGDALRTLGARGRFTFSPQPGARRHLLLFAAGSGITPVFSILKSALHFEPNSRITLVYGNRSADSAIFGGKLERLRAKYPERLRVVHVLSQGDAPGALRGRITRERVAEWFDAYSAQDMLPTEYYACGPAGMMDEVVAGLTMRGVDADSIRMESFSPPKPKPAEPAAIAAAAPKRVVLELHGESHRFEVAADQTLLEAALANGVQAPFSCRSGFCTACMCTRVSGELRMREEHGLSAAEVKQGYALMCIGYPMSEELRLRID
jgi:ring-1,2-phenylacetyl-CoA epoxidase subunit PaaE